MTLVTHPQIIQFSPLSQRQRPLPKALHCSTSFSGKQNHSQPQKINLSSFWGFLLKFSFLSLLIPTFTQCTTTKGTTQHSNVMTQTTGASNRDIMLKKTSDAELTKQVEALPVNERIRLAEERVKYTIVDVFDPIWNDTLTHMPEVALPHGIKMSMGPRNAFPDGTVTIIEIDRNRNHSLSNKEMEKALQKVPLDHDFLIFSMSPQQPIPVNDIKNISEAEQTRLLSEYKQWIPTINELERLAREGILVSVPIGNTQGYVNQFSFADGVLVAGYNGGNKHLKHIELLSDHPELVTHRASPLFYITAKGAPEHKAYIDFNGDGSIDFISPSTLAEGKVKTGYEIGTSNSNWQVPVAIMKRKAAIARQILDRDNVPYEKTHTSHPDTSHPDASH